MNSFASEALPVRVRKRKAELGRGVSTKKARRSITPEVEGMILDDVGSNLNC